jgi:hypothetical protein
MCDEKVVEREKGDFELRMKAAFATSRRQKLYPCSISVVLPVTACSSSYSQHPSHIPATHIRRILMSEKGAILGLAGLCRMHQIVRLLFHLRDDRYFFLRVGVVDKGKR